ncbi:MAG TPA: GYF domain-containing protein, partial [Polyangia bacterium]
MKIICDNCATKYSIADEKVRGKVFKIRCKKCSHIIVVRGQDQEAAAPPPAEGEDAGKGFDQKETRVFDYSGFDTAGAASDPAAAAASAAAAAPAPAPTGGETPVWHVVIDREQVGPMTPSEVRERFARGEIDAETYAWREGFEDWIRLASIEDFAELFAGTAAFASPFTGGEAADAVGGLAASAPPDDGGGDLFGERPQPMPESQSEPFAAADAGPVFASTPARSADLFGAADGGMGLGGGAEPGGDNGESAGGMFASAAAPAAAPSARIGEVRPMTGQRNENSVLFSLSNLSAIATGGPASAPSAPKPGFATPQSEGSGLIDIRSMAAQTLQPARPADGGGGGSMGIDDIPSFSPSFSPTAAPVLLPTASEGMPKWVWPVIGVGGALVIAIVVMVVMLAKKPGPVQLAPTGVVATGPSASGPTGGIPTTGGGDLAVPPTGPKIALNDTKTPAEAGKPTGA